MPILVLPPFPDRTRAYLFRIRHPACIPCAMTAAGLDTGREYGKGRIQLANQPQRHHVACAVIEVPSHQYVVFGYPALIALYDIRVLRKCVCDRQATEDDIVTVLRSARMLFSPEPRHGLVYGICDVRCPRIRSSDYGDTTHTTPKAQETHTAELKRTEHGHIPVARPTVRSPLVWLRHGRNGQIQNHAPLYRARSSSLCAETFWNASRY